MKKIFFTVLALVLVIAASSVAASGEEDHDRAAVVDDFNGIVNATQNEIEFPAFKGLALLRENKLGTGMESWSRLELNEGRFAIIEENTDIQIAALADELTKGTKTTRVYMSGGKAWFDVSNELNEDESFEVNTPSCALSVRGTVFSVDVEEIDTMLTVYNGTVALRAEKDGAPLLDRKGDEINLEVSSGKVKISVMFESVLRVTLDELTVQDLIPFLKDGGPGAGGVYTILRRNMQSNLNFKQLLEQGLDDMTPDKVQEVVEAISGKSVSSHILEWLPIPIPNIFP